MVSDKYREGCSTYTRLKFDVIAENSLDFWMSVVVRCYQSGWRCVYACGDDAVLWVCIQIK